MRVNPENIFIVPFPASRWESFFRICTHPSGRNMMFSLSLEKLAAIAILSVLSANAFPQVPGLHPRQIPANATGVKTIKSPSGVTIRYSEPGKSGVCETTPGVNSYAGYVDLAPDAHTFFWFFEARHNPETAPLTLWLNGGPGSDSLIGLFQGTTHCYCWKLNH